MFKPHRTRFHHSEFYNTLVKKNPQRENNRGRQEELTVAAKILEIRSSCQMGYQSDSEGCQGGANGLFGPLSDCERANRWLMVQRRLRKREIFIFILF